MFGAPVVVEYPGRTNCLSVATYVGTKARSREQSKLACGDKATICSEHMWPKDSELPICSLAGAEAVPFHLLHKQFLLFAVTLKPALLTVPTSLPHSPLIYKQPLTKFAQHASKGDTRI